eukprot:Em0008g564a
MPSILSHARHYLKNVMHTSQSYCHGHLGAMDNTQCSFTLWGPYPLRQMKRSNTANLVLLGAPIGDLIFCAKFISSLRSKISDLLSRLQQIGSKDPQVAYRLSVATLLWQLLQIGIALGENHHLEQSIDDLNHIIGVSEALNLHLEPPEFQVALKWWLGMDTSQNACCAFCPSHALDPLGHHALTCKSGGDLIVRHNALRDTFLESCKQACIGGQLEAGPIAASPVPGSGQSSHDPAGGQEVAFIPIVFILLRIWGTLEFIFTEVYSKYFCTNSPAFLGVLSALRFLQAIGDGGQGWSNAILYIFNSPKIRNLLLKDLTTCCSRTANILNDCRNQMKVKTKDYEATTTSEFVRISVPDESHVEFGSSEH